VPCHCWEDTSMLYTHEHKQPRIDPASRIAPNATVCGDVTIGPNCSIGFGAVLTAESGPIAIGANCVIMDTAVIRGVRGNPVRIGDNVLVGPRAYMTGCEIAENAFVATGATVFNGARLGARAEVRINGIVHLCTARSCRRTLWCRRSAGLRSAIRPKSCRRTSMSGSGH